MTSSDASLIPETNRACVQGVAIAAVSQSEQCESPLLSALLSYILSCLSGLQNDEDYNAGKQAGLNKKPALIM